MIISTVFIHKDRRDFASVRRWRVLGLIHSSGRGQNGGTAVTFSPKSFIYFEKWRKEGKIRGSKKANHCRR